MAVADDLNLVGRASEVLRAFDNLSVTIRDSGFASVPPSVDCYGPTTPLFRRTSAALLPVVLYRSHKGVW